MAWLDAPCAQSEVEGWGCTDAWVEQMRPDLTFPLRPRGETSEGYAMTVEQMSMQIKCNILLMGAEEIDPESLQSMLPSWDEHVKMVCARCAPCI